MAEVRTVTATSSALRARASHAAEQISRLLLGERFEVLEEVDEGRWARGSGPDGYEGWIRTWHLAASISNPEPSLVVTSRWSRALEVPEPNSPVLCDLSFGTRLGPTRAEGSGFLPWLMPDGRSAWTPAEHLEPVGLSSGKDMAAMLELRGRRLLGIPYEWGGRSSAGLDCSGFVQLLFESLGIPLPRAAWQQAEIGIEVVRDHSELWLPGDLLFYGSPRVEHVGVWLGEDRLMHASGELKLENLEPGGRLAGNARPDLVAVRRIPPG